MITLGIDLAAEPKETAGCAVEWLDGAATVRWVSTGLLDQEILRRARDATVVGIDAPFGWPTYFVEAITAHHAGQRWPVDSWDKMSRRRLRLRITDERVHDVTGITPLSVSSDAIAIPATRCALLIDRLGVKDRSGVGRVQEVYPAAALCQWGLRFRGYKGRQNASVLAELFASLQEQAHWLTIATSDAQLLSANDHAFDALVASLVARAAWLELTLRPSVDEMAAARAEGWIALPQKGALASLHLAPGLSGGAVEP
jgi:predicted nuclease with RNAse H fold